MKRITLYRFFLVCLVAVSSFSFLAVNKDYCTCTSQAGRCAEAMTQDTESKEQAKKLALPDLALIEKALDLLSKYL